MLNAILYVAEHGCKWRGSPAHFGNRYTLCTRMNRWSRKGVLDQVFEQLQRERMVRIRVAAYGLDSTGSKVRPDSTGALKETVHRPSASPGATGTPDFMWLPRMPEQPLP